MLSIGLSEADKVNKDPSPRIFDRMYNSAIRIAIDLYPGGKVWRRDSLGGD